LLGRENFGCGSSREHAPWALLDYGIRCVIAPSFADIFYNNCFQNGMLPVVLPGDDINALFDDINATEGYQLTVNLDAQRITTPQGKPLQFSIDPFRKSCLLNGLDTIALTLQHEGDIAAYEAKQKTAASWLFPE
jgi:3-isopropylmalate/(R)-2-methylmalate dehydratase small subunit